MTKLLAAIHTVRWAAPTLRIGQLLINALQDSRPEVPLEDLHSILYNLSDDDLAGVVMEYARRLEELRRKAG